MRQFGCLKNVAPIWVSRTVVASTVRGIRICVNYGLNTVAGRFGLCTHSILDRSAILLLGGDKTGDDRWYDVHILIADRLYDEHLEQLRKEGQIDG